MSKRRGKCVPPGLRAIQASGDGLWELDLASGTAWFSDWFHARLGWRPDEVRHTWSALRDAMTPDSWRVLLEEMRNHLESDTPFDLELPLTVGGAQTGWWRFHGRAERNELRHPMYFAGCARDVSAEHSLRAGLAEEITWLRGAFEMMPAAAAVLDDSEVIVAVNRRWRDLLAQRAALREHGGLGGTLRQVMASAGAEHARCERVALDDQGRRTLILWHDGARARAPREDSR
ncbi:MAG: hypothetical protein KGI55_05945 [Gammaproteobacteria bacterium]|nr:hypothetical protein [Gammaproteobacteria bacterium]